jgi:hypothetical protein
MVQVSYMLGSGGMMNPAVSSQLCIDLDLIELGRRILFGCTAGWLFSTITPEVIQH